MSTVVCHWDTEINGKGKMGEFKKRFVPLTPASRVGKIMEVRLLQVVSYRVVSAGKGGEFGEKEGEGEDLQLAFLFPHLGGWHIPCECLLVLETVIIG